MALDRVRLHWGKSQQMNRAKWIFIIGVSLLGLVGFIYLLSNAKRMPLLNDSQAMRQEIVERVPIGTNISKAQNIMQANGFNCKMTKHEAFEENDPIRGTQGNHVPTDFLYCDQSALAGLFIWRRWQVAIVDKHGKVSDVYVSISLTGF